MPQIESIYQQILAQFANIDILINNIDVLNYDYFENLSYSQIVQTTNVNYLAPV